MDYSHRDRRAQRNVRRAAVVFGLTILTLLALADLAPFLWARGLAVLGLAAAGGLFVLYGDRLTREYAHDLASARSGEPISGALRVEVESEVGLDRPVVRPSVRSPHVRRRPVLPDQIRPPKATEPDPGLGRGLGVRPESDPQ